MLQTQKEIKAMKQTNTRAKKKKKNISISDTEKLVDYIKN